MQKLVKKLAWMSGASSKGIIVNMEKIKLKISDMRLLNITVFKDEIEIYKGKVEDAPEEVKNMEYKDIKFDGVDVILKV